LYRCQQPGRGGSTSAYAFHRYGASWEAGYEIASLSSGDEYQDPHVYMAARESCTWSGSTGRCPPGRDNAVRHRRALNYAAGGISDWDPTVYLTSNLDGCGEFFPPWPPPRQQPGGDLLRRDSPALTSGARSSAPPTGATWPAGNSAWYPVHYFMQLLACPERVHRLEPVLLLLLRLPVGHRFQSPDPL
jgi:hypothetical protein